MDGFFLNLFAALLRYGLINMKGEYVIAPGYKKIDLINGGIYRCETHSGGYKYFNMRFEEIIPH